MKKLWLIEKLIAIEPGRNLVFTAIDKLRAPEEIEQFIKDYPHFIAENNAGITMAEAKRIAYGNIGYVLGYYSQETAERWLAASDEISHPVFGRSIPYSQPRKAHEKGQRNAGN